MAQVVAEEPRGSDQEFERAPARRRLRFREGAGIPVVVLK
jgi:hypothetical protein